jgi:putative oxidoreductase
MAERILARFLTILEQWGWPLGYLFMACIFVWSGLGKLMNPGATASVMSAAGIPLPGVLVYAASAIEICGGIALAFGWKRGLAALLLAMYIAAVSLTMHAFWRPVGAEQQSQFVQFLKNTSILGGLLFVAFAQRGGRRWELASFGSRLLVVLIFIMNAFGVVSQERSMHELVVAGAPERLAPWLIRAGQLTQAIAALLLLFPRPLMVVIGALLLAGFLVPATLVAHSFWMATPDNYQAQIINFLKNLAANGSLLVLAAFYAREWIRSHIGTGSGAEARVSE